LNTDDLKLATKQTEAFARSFAAYLGLKASKYPGGHRSRRNEGSFRLVDPSQGYCGKTILGETFNATAQEVIDYCMNAQRSTTWKAAYEAGVAAGHERKVVTSLNKLVERVRLRQQQEAA
jgi:hypothetical protein